MARRQATRALETMASQSKKACSDALLCLNFTPFVSAASCGGIDRDHDTVGGAAAQKVAPGDVHFIPNARSLTNVIAISHRMPPDCKAKLSHDGLQNHVSKMTPPASSLAKTGMPQPSVKHKKRGLSKLSVRETDWLYYAPRRFGHGCVRICRCVGRSPDGNYER